MIKHWRPAAILLVAVVVLATVLATAGTVFGFPGVGHRDNGRDGAQTFRDADGDDAGPDSGRFVSPGKVIVPNEATVRGLLAKAVDEGHITQDEFDQLLEWWQSRPEALMLTGTDIVQIAGWWQARPVVVMKLIGQAHAIIKSPARTIPEGLALPEGMVLSVDDSTAEALLALGVANGLITQAQADDLMQWWQSRPEALEPTQEDVDAIDQWVEGRPAVVDRLADIYGLMVRKQLALLGLGPVAALIR